MYCFAHSSLAKPKVPRGSRSLFFYESQPTELNVSSYKSDISANKSETDFKAGHILNMTYGDRTNNHNITDPRFVFLDCSVLDPLGRPTYGQ